MPSVNKNTINKFTSQQESQHKRTGGRIITNTRITQNNRGFLESDQLNHQQTMWVHQGLLQQLLTAITLESSTISETMDSQLQE